MKRTLLLIGALAVCAWAWSPQQSLAHRWRWGCGSYYRGYSNYYPRYYSSYWPSYSSYPGYYSSYNYCSPYYGNYGSYYGGYGSYYGGYGGGYSPAWNYGYSPQYGYAGSGWGGGSLLSVLTAGSLAGGGLGGSLLQPSYLSMPVSAGYGRPGYLQIPVGGQSGRASYLQLPVNAGYGPTSYLQIELGRSASNAGAETPAPSAAPTAPPFGEVPGTSAAAADRVARDIPRTPSDEIPTIASPAMGGSTEALAKNAAESAGSVSPSTAEARPAGGSQFHLVSFSRPAAAAAQSPRTAAPVAKDTSFSLVEPDLSDGSAQKPEADFSVAQDTAPTSDRETIPWVVK